MNRADVDDLAAFAARQTYAESRRHLHAEWKALARDGYETWAREVWNFALIAERAYKAELADPEPRRG